MAEQDDVVSSPSQDPEISVVVPVLNEELAVPRFVEAVASHLAGESYEVVFIDDGSTDRTWETVCRLAQAAPVRGVRLTRNVGKEAALTAGLSQARGRAHIPMDVDLQDPPELLPEMIQRWRAGAHMVLCRRRSRDESWAKRWTASLYYRLAAKGSHVELPAQVGDFRLIDAYITERFLQLPERNRFNKGLLALVAPTSVATIDFDRPQGREGGRPRQSWGKLLALGIDGLVSFSTWPLRMLSILGFAMLAFSIAGTLVSVLLRVFGVIEIPGQLTVVIVGLFLAGFQALGMGILGEYLARILIEVKARPLFIIDSTQSSVVPTPDQSSCEAASASLAENTHRR